MNFSLVSRAFTSAKDLFKRYVWRTASNFYILLKETEKLLDVKIIKQINQSNLQRKKRRRCFTFDPNDSSLDHSGQREKKREKKVKNKIIRKDRRKIVHPLIKNQKELTLPDYKFVDASGLSLSSISFKPDIALYDICENQEDEIRQVIIKNLSEPIVHYSSESIKQDSWMNLDHQSNYDCTNLNQMNMEINKRLMAITRPSEASQLENINMNVIGHQDLRNDNQLEEIFEEQEIDEQESIEVNNERLIYNNFGAPERHPKSKQKFGIHPLFSKNFSSNKPFSKRR